MCGAAMSSASLSCCGWRGALSARAMRASVISCAVRSWLWHMSETYCTAGLVGMWDAARPGGAMVIALLVCLSATVATSLITYGEEDKGPLAAVLVTDANANGNEVEHRALAKTGGEQSESTI